MIWISIALKMQMSNIHMKRCSIILVTREMQVKPSRTDSTSFMSTRMAKIKEAKNYISLGKYVETAGGNVKWSSYFERVWQIFKMLNRVLPHGLIILLPVIEPREGKWVKLALPLRKIKISQCPSANEWTEQMWYIHTMEHYSPMKRNEVLTCYIDWHWKHCTKWKNPVTRRHMWMSRTGKSIKTESKFVIGRRYFGRRGGGMTSNGYGISFWGDWKYSEIM